MLEGLGLGFQGLGFQDAACLASIFDCVCACVTVSMLCVCVCGRMCWWACACACVSAYVRERVGVSQGSSPPGIMAQAGPGPDPAIVPRSVHMRLLYIELKTEECINVIIIISIISITSSNNNRSLCYL